jgi:hypothetical protein
VSGAEERAAAARRAALEAGFPGVGVRACGHDGQVAAVSVPEVWRERALREGLPELAAAIRGAGFRYVAIEMGEEG